jgi:hypothetical protein
MSLFSLSDFEELSGAVSEVILSLSFTDSENEKESKLKQKPIYDRRQAHVC